MEILKEATTDLEVNGALWSLRYALLAQPDEEQTRYGVAVSNDTTGERAMISDVLLRPTDGEALLSRMAAGGVTPLTLREVVEDFVAEI